MPSAARSCATPGAPSRRSSTARRWSASSGRTRPRPIVGRLDTAFSRLKLDLGSSAADIAADPAAGPVAQAFVRYEAAHRGARRRWTSTTWSAAPSTSWRPTRPAGRVAPTVRPPARRRGPGRRPLAAAPRPPPGRPGEPDLPRRRRRPVDLRLAIGRCAPRAGAGRGPPRPPARRPRGEPPLPRPGRRARRPTDRAQPASDSPRSIRPRPDAAGLWSWRRTPATNPPAPSACSARGPMTTGLAPSWLARTASFGRRSSPRWTSANRSAPPPWTCSSTTRRWTRCWPASPRRRTRGAAARAARRAPARARTGPRRNGPCRRPCSAGRRRTRHARARRRDRRRRAPVWPSFAGRRRLSLATAHSTKGAEFDHVAVVGMEEGRFPSGRAVAESDEPVRAMEEERRLGYVAWTRARGPSR